MNYYIIKLIMKKLFITLLTSFTIICGVVILYLFYPSNFFTFDNKIRDMYFLARGEVLASDDIVIVDIDERSLNELGQWPWQRFKVAKILENLTLAGVGIIGFDIVFAESDNSSPRNIASLIGINRDDLIDYDEILGEMIANTPTILGFVFEVEQKNLDEEKLEDIFINLPAIFIEKNLKENFLITPKRAILNIDILQDNSYSSGFFNALPDSDGVVRSVPLLMKYKNEIYPSLSFEMLRVALDSQKVILNYGAVGIESAEVGDLNIPLDRFGRLFINYRGGKKSFKYISAKDIYNNNFNKKDIEGKFVLIGTSAQGLLDLRTTPYDSRFPGVEIHANIIDNILNQNFIYQPSWVEAIDLINIIALSLIVAIILSFANPIFMLLISILTIFGLFYSTYYILFEYGIILNVIFPLISLTLIIFTTNIISFFLESKQKELIKSKFAKKVSPAVVEDLLKHSDDSILEGREKEVTIFFSDIRGFTSISEKMGSPKALIKVLNQYMNPMVDIIVHCGGTVDKFIGDAIMAYWNAPLNIQNHQDRALNASILQIKALKKLNKILKRENKPEINIGIGLNTGIATVGEMGSSGRSDYTLIGDSVNLGSRLEGLNKPYGTQLLISESTKVGLKEKYIIRDLDLVRVKGKLEPVKIFEVIDFGEAKDELKDELNLYHQALKLYRDANFKKALDIFEALFLKKVNNKIYQLYTDRCKHFIENPPEKFDGVFTFKTK